MKVFIDADSWCGMETWLAKYLQKYFLVNSKKNAVGEKEGKKLSKRCLASELEIVGIRVQKHEMSK